MKFIVVEDDKNCLATAQLKQYQTGDINLVCFEVNPKYAGKEKKPIKYIGETLLSYLAKKTQVAGGNLSINSPNSDALEFYSSKCGFIKPNNKKRDLILTSIEAQELISQNEAHTASKIFLV